MKIKLSRNKIIKILFYCILILPFLNEKIFFYNKTIINALKIIAAVYFTINIIKDTKNLKLTKTDIILVLFSLYSFFITIYNSLLSFGVFFSIYFLVVSTLFLKKNIIKNDYSYLMALYIIHNLLLLLNLPSLITQLSVTGYNRMFFLGGKNALTLFCIMTIFYNYIIYYLLHKKVKIKYIFFILLSIITVILGGSSTGLVIMLAMILVILFNKKVKFNSLLLYSVYIIAFFVLMNSNIIEKIPFLYHFITEILGKDITFTYRTVIWQHSLNYISQNIWGYGIGNSILLRDLYYLNINECHNMIIQLLFDGGIILLTLFITYFIFCNNESRGNKNKSLVNLVKYTIFIVFLLGLTESICYKIDLWYLFLILSVSQHIKEETNEKD